MAVYEEGPLVTRVAGADLSAAAYKIVKQQSDRTVILATAGTDMSLGVVELGAASGGEVSVMARNASGTFKVLLGGTVAVGDALTATTGGVAITTTTPNDEVIGYAQEAGVITQVIEYLPAFRKY